MNVIQKSFFTTNMYRVKNYFEGSKSILGLVNDTFWKSIFGPFFAFGFPIIFIAILGSLLGFDQLLGGALAISPMAISLTSMPVAIFEFKKSSLLKRIGVTSVHPSLFLLIIALYYFFIILLSVVWCIIFSLLIFGIPNWDTGKTVSAAVYAGGVLITPEIKSLTFSQALNNVNWGGFFYGQILSIFVGITIGLFLVSVAKSTIAIQAIGVTILITSQFLSSQVLPPSMIRDINALWYLGYVISPFKASTNIILESWNGQIINPLEVFIPYANNDFLIPNVMASNPFAVDSSYYFYSSKGLVIEILNSSEKWASMFIPFIWIFIFTFVAIKKFKWSTR